MNQSENLPIDAVQRCMILYYIIPDCLFYSTSETGHEQVIWHSLVNTLRSRQNGRRVTENIFKRIFSMQIGMFWFKLHWEVLNGPIGNTRSLVQIMAWHWTGDKPLFEPMMT